MRTPILELSNVTKSYRRAGEFGSNERFTALSGVSLTVHDGECLGIVGESGAGKSTVGRIMLGLERPDSGSVRFLGRDMYREGGRGLRDLRQHLQVVFQDCFSSVNPRFRAADIIGEPLRNYRHMSASEVLTEAKALLELVGLRDSDAFKYPHQFSGGELQRVCIARAISLQPRLIVLDECVSSLDMLVQEQVLELLANLQERFGMAYVFISHDLQAVRWLASRLIVLASGQAVETLDDLEDLSALRHPASRRLIDAILPAQPAHRSGCPEAAPNPQL